MRVGTDNVEYKKTEQEEQMMTTNKSLAKVHLHMHLARTLTQDFKTKNTITTMMII